MTGESLSKEQIAKIIVYSLDGYSLKKTAEMSNSGMFSVWKYRKEYIKQV